MCERVNAIEKYYENLEYNVTSKKEALTEISNLSEKVKPKGVINISTRLLETLCIVQNNFALFESACGHVDIINSIIQYLQHYGLKCQYSDIYGDELMNEIWSLLYTLFLICPEHEMQLFLRDVILNDWFTQLFALEENEELFSTPNIGIILLEDSDLYAVINHLKIIGKCHLNKILVQESISKKFSSLIKKYIKNMSFSIHTFRLKQELFTSSISDKLNIVSIWSEDVRVAKNLARALQQQIVFINTYMDFYTSIMLLSPEREDLDFSLFLVKSEDKSAIKSKSPIKHEKIYNLFYNGTWHKPVRNEYWTHYCYVTHMIVKYADASVEDFEVCFKSAKKGYKIWSTWSIDSRKRVLSKFASVLECKGKFELSKIVLKWLQFTHFNKSHFQTDLRLEVLTVAKPKGIIYIDEEDHITLFQILIQSLIIGNSVIVIINLHNSYNLIPYCDLFSMSDIPPGVINVMTTINYKGGNFIQKYRTNPKETFVNLVNFRKIILPLQ